MEKESVTYSKLCDEAKKHAISEVIRYEKNKNNTDNPLKHRVMQFINQRWKEKHFIFKGLSINEEEKQITLEKMDKPYQFLQKILPEDLKEVYTKATGFRSVSFDVEMENTFKLNDNNATNIFVVYPDITAFIFPQFVKNTKDAWLEISFILKFDKSDDLAAKYTMIDIIYKDQNVDSMFNREFREELGQDVVKVFEQYLEDLNAVIRSEINSLVKQSFEMIAASNDEKEINEFYQTLIEKSESNRYMDQYKFDVKGNLLNIK